MAPQACFDIIGDVHGRYQTLINLLKTLCYQQIDDIWQKPGHKAVFVGDLIDKGENPAGVLRLVRAMVEAGHAQMVVDNHELNWVRDAHAFQQTPSQFVQATRQHHDRRRLVEAFAAEEQGLENLLAHFQWLREQPLYLELRLGPNIACLDYAAAYHGVLMAYTHTLGTPLQSSNFTWVDVQEAAATI